jgi:UDP-N-acetylmuramate--alanine ligase
MENDYYAMNMRKNGIKQSYDLMYQGQKLVTINLSVPGMHNIYNSLAACAVADYFGVPMDKIAESLEGFTGVHRRFELLGTPKGITVVDDFAHHPTELKATLNTAMELGFKHVWAVFQPHTFSRTAMLLDDFADALKIPDTAIISEILPVREVNTYNIYSTDLGKKVPNSVCLDTFDEITEYIKKNAKEGDLVLTMGGGNVYMCANQIVKALSE